MRGCFEAWDWKAQPRAPDIYGQEQLGTQVKVGGVGGAESAAAVVHRDGLVCFHRFGKGYDRLSLLFMDMHTVNGKDGY